LQEEDPTGPIGIWAGAHEEEEEWVVRVGISEEDYRRAQRSREILHLECSKCPLQCSKLRNIEKEAWDESRVRRT